MNKLTRPLERAMSVTYPKIVKCPYPCPKPTPEPKHQEYPLVKRPEAVESVSIQSEPSCKYKICCKYEICRHQVFCQDILGFCFGDWKE